VHYRNGREAKNCYKVVMLPTWSGQAAIGGILYDATPGNDACNGRIAIATANDPVANLSQCVHADDVAEAFPQTKK